MVYWGVCFIEGRVHSDKQLLVYYVGYFSEILYPYSRFQKVPLN